MNRVAYDTAESWGAPGLRAGHHPLAGRGMAAGRNVSLLREQINEFCPLTVSLQDADAAQGLAAELNGAPKVVHGAEGLIELATMPEADIVLIAIVGTAGLQPALAAIRAGKDIALASK